MEKEKRGEGGSEGGRKLRIYSTWLLQLNEINEKQHNWTSKCGVFIL